METDIVAISSEELMGYKGFILYVEIDSKKELAIITRVVELINNV